MHPLHPLAFHKDHRVTPCWGKRDINYTVEDCEDLNDFFRDRRQHRILSGLRQGWIKSITLERFGSEWADETGVWIQIVLRPELDILWRNMAKWRIEHLQEKYLCWLGLSDPSYYALNIGINIGLDDVTHAQWAAKAARERAERRAGRPKKHNLYFLRCIRV